MAASETKMLELIPWLFLKGISTDDVSAALHLLTGERLDCVKRRLSSEGTMADFKKRPFHYWNRFESIRYWSWLTNSSLPYFEIWGNVSSRVSLSSAPPNQILSPKEFEQRAIVPDPEQSAFPVVLNHTMLAGLPKLSNG